MIDISQLTSLISAFRVETEIESISPETVGKMLHDITDLLANASTDAERHILDDWKDMLSQYIVVYDVAHATGMSDMQTIPCHAPSYRRYESTQHLHGYYA